MILGVPRELLRLTSMNLMSFPSSRPVPDKEEGKGFTIE